MNSGTTRLSVTEYGNPTDIFEQIPKTAKIDRLFLNRTLADAGLRIASYLGMTTNPIVFETKGVRVKDVAGIIRLTPSLELEISPKFLGVNEAGTGWREDFFFLSTLSRHGQLLANEHLSSSSGAARDLSTLVARAFTSMYRQQRHRPLRAYRRTKRSDFSFDGEPDPVDLIFPSLDGFEQEVILFDRNNVWNANIFSAAKELLPELDDTTAANLLNVIEDLSPQNKRRTLFAKGIPARHRGWQSLHDLSIDVLQGLGLTYKQGQAHAPGFVSSTWKIWEDLIAIACRISFGRNLVSTQLGFDLGKREKISPAGSKSSQLTVYPDYIIEADETHPRFVVDAKYKGNIEYGPIRISEADIYESLAFARATNCTNIVLIYPVLANNTLLTVGMCKTFEKIVVGDIYILGVQVEVRGLSKNGALKLFSNNLKVNLINIIKSI